MSEIKDCSSTGCLSLNNVTNNENEKISTSATIIPMEKAGNEISNIFEKEAIQSEVTKMESEHKSSEASNVPKDDTISVSDIILIKKESSEVEEIPLIPPVTKEDNSSSMASRDEKVLISKLEEEVKEKIDERDMYQRKLAETEKKLADLEATIATTINNTDNNVANAHTVLTELKNKLKEATMQLADRGVIMANQEKQISALNHQVTKLKEVVAITRDLLQIRNVEVKHLQTEVDDMEARIAEEREKHNTMISKMDSAVRLNSDLKKEYEIQLGLFKDLRIKYDEKITLLSEEKRALELANQSAIDQAEKN